MPELDARIHAGERWSRGSSGQLAQAATAGRAPRRRRPDRQPRGDRDARPTPGHVSFLDTRDRTLIAGDVFTSYGGLAVTSHFHLRFPFAAIATWDKQRTRGVGAGPARARPGAARRRSRPGTAPPPPRWTRRLQDTTVRGWIWAAAGTCCLQRTGGRRGAEPREAVRVRRRGERRRVGLIQVEAERRRPRTPASSSRSRSRRGSWRRR